MGPLGGASEEPKGWWPRLRVPLFAALIVLVGALALMMLARRGEEKNREWAAAVTAAPPTESAPPALRANISPLGDLTQVDASDLYPKIKQQAEQWSKGARLISIVAGPVVGSKVDLSAAGAEIVYQFAAGLDATGREQPPDRLALHVTREGIKPGPANETTKSHTESAARDPQAPPIPSEPGEPNCVSEAAAKAARASGIPPNLAMRLRYEVDRILRRGVWTAKVDSRRDLDRVIDGKTCAIVVRR